MTSRKEDVLPIVRKRVLIDCYTDLGLLNEGFDLIGASFEDSGVGDLDKGCAILLSGLGLNGRLLSCWAMPIMAALVCP